MIQTRAIIVWTALWAVVLLGGCATPIAEPDMTAPVIPSPAASPTPEPTKPAADELVITASGLGYVVVGQPVPEVEGELAIVRWDPMVCANDGLGDVEYEEGDPRAGAWVPDYPDASGDEPALFTVLRSEFTRGAPVTDVWTRSPQVRSAAGIAPGDSLTDLLAAHSHFTEVIENGDRSRSYSIEGAEGTLVYEVAAMDQPGFWEVDTVGIVAVIAPGRSVASYIGDASYLCG